MKCSIILTTYNRELDCIRCLNVLKQQLNSHIEVLLLDDWHIKSNNLLDFCIEHDFKYIWSGAQKNNSVKWRVPGYAYNIGAKVAKGEKLIIGNAEILQLDNTCVEKMISEYKISSPAVYAEPEKNYGIDGYKNFRKLNSTLPFFFCMPKELYFDIGGYDEDFIGYAWEDNDFSDRVLSLRSFVEIDSDTIHLWNSKGVYSRGDPKLTESAWEYNRQLYETRRGILKRNLNGWGSL